MAMPPLLQRIENLRKSLFGTGSKLLGSIMPYGNKANTVCEGDDAVFPMPEHRNPILTPPAI